MEAIILAPVMPVWDNGLFCAPLVTLLTNKGFKVSIIDTLSLIKSPDPKDAIEAVHYELSTRTHSPFLLVGFAMAGTLVQILSHRMDCLTGIMTISAPGYVDDLLQERIGYLVSLLDKGCLNQAIKSLHQFVVPEGKKIQAFDICIPPPLRQMAVNRMRTGFSLLLRCDARRAITQYNGKYLGIVGEKSQLARWENQVHSRNPLHTCFSIPKAGMRPWDDNASAVNLLVNEWIEEL